MLSTLFPSLFSAPVSPPLSVDKVAAVWLNQQAYFNLLHCCTNTWDLNKQIFPTKWSTTQNLASTMCHQLYHPSNINCTVKHSATSIAESTAKCLTLYNIILSHNDIIWYQLLNALLWYIFTSIAAPIHCIILCSMPDAPTFTLFCSQPFSTFTHFDTFQW